MLEVTFDLADQILTMPAEEAGQAWAPEDFGPFAKVTKEAPAGLLDEMSVTVLRQRAKAAGVKGFSKMAKPDLIAALS